MPENHEGIDALVKSFSSLKNYSPKITSSPLVCDANFYFEKGIPSIVFGPGDVSMNIHGANEFITTESIIEACKIYAQMIINWCGLKD